MMDRLYRLYSLAVASLLLLPASLATLQAQGSAESNPEVSGTEYFVSFPPSHPDAANQFMGLMITSEFATTGTVEIPNVESLVNPWDTIRGYTTRPFSVRPGEVTYIEVPRLVEPYYPDGPNGDLSHNGEASLRSVHVTSRAPISVTAVNARQGVSGAYSALPVDRWGTDYSAVALPATPNNLELTSQLTITAAYDNTEVSVYLSADAGRWDAGEEISQFTLNRGQVWLLQADAVPGTSGSMDLTSTYINASRPVGIVAGHTRAALAEDPDALLGGDQYWAWHAEAQMPLNGDEWGSEYFSTPTRDHGDRFRIIARDRNTLVTVELFDEAGSVVGTKEFYLRLRGDYVDVAAPDGMTINRPARWSSSKPFGIYQIRLSDGGFSDPRNRPAFLRLVPTTRYAERTVTALPYAFRNEKFGEFTADLVVRGTSSPLTDVTLDGTELDELTGVTATLITDNSWHITLKTGSGGHVLQGENGAVLSGRVGGANGPTGGVALDWTLPHWNMATEYDREAPYLVETQNTSKTSVEVVISDRTESYFSGVAEIEVWESPGWERIDRLISPDPEVDGTARFGVREGYDPSGPLKIRIIDRDGNEAIIQVHDGVCLQTAYAVTDTLFLYVRSNGYAEGDIVIEANPCGDAANVSVATFDLSGDANSDLLEPVLTSGGNLPQTIDPFGTISFRITTRDDLPDGRYRHHTHLEVRIDDAVISVPVVVDVDYVSSVEEKIDWVEKLDLR